MGKKCATTVVRKGGVLLLLLLLLTSGYKSLLTLHHRKVIMAMFRSVTSVLNPSQTCMYLVDVHWCRLGRVHVREQRNI